MFIPNALLKQLYTRGSLKNTIKGMEFSLKNRLKDVVMKELVTVKLNDEKIPLDNIRLLFAEGVYTPEEIVLMGGVDFPLRKVVTFQLDQAVNANPKEKNTLEVVFRTVSYGKLKFQVEDYVAEKGEENNKIPRDSHNDYKGAAINSRVDFVRQRTGKTSEHIHQYSVNPESLEGNIEHFIGMAQVPLGIAGPMKVNGEHAQGEFVIPLATTEGTLVASYNRGIKVANLSGGIKATVQDDAMQRAPVFVFEDARGARDFVAWIKDNFQIIKNEAEQTSSIANLTYIDHFLSNKFAFLRFNFRTGDAAGQNMVGKATFAACSWILDNYDGVQNFYLESNFATDKKASQINIMRTRGKRVTAEVTISREVLEQYMRVTPDQIDYHSRVASIGSFLSGVNNNGLHAANGITAMFIATGQDVANVSESSAGVIYTEVTPEGGLYLSLTIPSLIVATYGGGTGIGTQKECLEMLDCYGKNKVLKFAEIVAAVALAGEISLASAISSSDWVSSHEQYGRNR